MRSLSRLLKTPEATAEESKGAEAGTNAEDKKEDDAQVKLQEELASFKDKYLRLYSEFDNFRKRTAKEKADFLKSANKDLILGVLPVIDDLDRANKAYDPEKSKCRPTEGRL